MTTTNQDAVAQCIATLASTGQVDLIRQLITTLANNGQEDLAKQFALDHVKALAETPRQAPEQATPAWLKIGYVFEHYSALMEAASNGLEITSEQEFTKRALSLAPANQSFTSCEIRDALLQKKDEDPNRYGLKTGDWILMRGNTEEPQISYVIRLSRIVEHLTKKGIFIRERDGGRTYRLASAMPQAQVIPLTPPAPVMATAQVHAM
jgi:hypothetical protein